MVKYWLLTFIVDYTTESETITINIITNNSSTITINEKRFRLWEQNNCEHNRDARLQHNDISQLNQIVLVEEDLEICEN